MSYIGNEPVISATRTITEVVASGGQTVFYPNGGYTVGYLDVAVNGSTLQSSDFVATNGTSVTLNVACAANDDVKLIAWGTFTSSSSYTQAQVDSKVGASQFGFKNRIINGAMMIDQRNNGASVTANSPPVFSVDRFGVYGSQASKFTAQQNAGSVTPPVGFVNYLGCTSSSAYSITSTDQFLLTHKVEGLNISDLAWGTASAQTVTLSFWVRSSLTGTFGGSIQNSAANRCYPFSFTISAANTWEQKTVTIAGDTTGTWLTTNGIGATITFSLGTGSTYSATAGSWTGSSSITSSTGATSVVGTSGATFYITGVQLEKGSTATSFDYRPYGTELALCQRYFIALGGGSAYQALAMGVAVNTTNIDYALYNLPVTMRSTPAVAISGAFRVDDGYSASSSITSVSAVQMGTSVGAIGIGGASGLTTGRLYQLQANNSTASRLQFSSEL